MCALSGAECAEAFITDLVMRIKNRVPITTRGLKVYVDASEGAFGCDVDYAQLVWQCRDKSLILNGLLYIENSHKKYIGK